MLRQPLVGLRLPLKAFNRSTQQAAWNGAWRRLFTSQTKSQLPQQLLRWKTTSWQGMMARLRSGAAGSRSTTTPGMMQSFLRRGFRFTARRSGQTAAKDAPETLGLKARLKKLIKEYGWITVGVYFALSVLDFPFCFLLVRFVGTERIGRIEHAVVSTVTNLIPESVKEAWHKAWAYVKKTETDTLGDDDISDHVEMATWGVEEAQKQNDEKASLGTQLALAYAIHKSCIFLRVPLTAALTPKVVKVLRSWGWKIARRRP